METVIQQFVQPHGTLEHMKGLEDFAELREVARRHDDDRARRRYCDIFGEVTGDINLTYATPASSRLACAQAPVR